MGLLTLYIIYSNSMLLGVLSGVVNHDGSAPSTGR